MGTYIDDPDVNVNIIKQFELTDYIIRADKAVVDIAEELGVRDTTDIETDPVHWKVKEYAKAFLITDVCLDKMGTNNVETPDVEKYIVLYDVWHKRLKELKTEITYPMVTGDVDEIRDRASIATGWLFRG